MKKLILTILFCLMTFLLIACNSTSEETDSEKEITETAETTTTDTQKLAVTVSFNALYEFTYAVGQDKVDISTIIPAGTEPHDFEPKAADIAGLSTAKVFIYSGFGMESWADEAIESADNQSLTIVVASDGLTALSNESDEEEGQYDPHIWLSLKNAQVEVQNIADGLSEADPDNKDYYQANAADYIEQLETLFEEYKTKFDSVTNKDFVTGHAAFHYFCNDFGLSQNSVEDVYAEGEPSTKQLAELVDYCKENNVTTVFAEEMASPEVSKTLADEVGADVKTIYTIESPEDNLSYLERMTKNCEEIYESLSK